MVTNLFRRNITVAETIMIDPEPVSDDSICEEKLKSYEEQLTYLSQQKELHTLALKEMYQFLIKLDTSVREENQKLRAQIKAEHERSEKLIEVTKGLWDIIELMDDGNEGAARLIDLTRDVEELARFEVEISDESAKPSLDTLNLNEITPMIDAVAN